MILPSIVVTTRSELVTDDDVRQALRGLQFQINYHFALHWNAGCTLNFVSADGRIPEKSWHLDILDRSPMEHMRGLHRTEDNQPRLDVFARDDAESGRPWTVTASHEILETLADPWASWCWSVKEHDEQKFIGLEVCDPVADETYTVEIDDAQVEVSNFVLPNWFRPGSKPKYDHLGTCQTPLEVRPKGFKAQYTLRHGWQYLRADGTTVGSGDDLTPVSLQRRAERELEISDKRIAEYLYELVNDPEKMQAYWDDKEKALAESGLTPAQQYVLLHKDYSIIRREVHVDARRPLGTDFMGPDFLGPDFMGPDFMGPDLLDDGGREQ